MYPTAAVFVGIFLAPILAAEKCVPSSSPESSSCACKLSDTETYINLSPLQNSSSNIPRFTTDATTGKEEEGWKFSYNPCKPFSMFTEANYTSSCKNVAVARWTPTQLVCQNLGEQESVKFSTEPYDLSAYGLDQSNVTLIYSTEKEEKLNNRALIHLVCNATMTRQDSIFQFLTENYTLLNDYYFALESPCACPGLCGKPPQPEPTSKPSKEPNDSKWIIIGASIGAVLLLLLIIVIVMYCRKRRGYAQV